MCACVPPDCVWDGNKSSSWKLRHDREPGTSGPSSLYTCMYVWMCIRLSPLYPLSVCTAQFARFGASPLPPHAAPAKMQVKQIRELATGVSFIRSAALPGCGWASLLSSLTFDPRRNTYLPIHTHSRPISGIQHRNWPFSRTSWRRKLWKKISQARHTYRNVRRPVLASSPEFHRPRHLACHRNPGSL